MIRRPTDDSDITAAHTKRRRTPQFFYPYIGRRDPYKFDFDFPPVNRVFHDIAARAEALLRPLAVAEIDSLIYWSEVIVSDSREESIPWPENDSAVLSAVLGRYNFSANPLFPGHSDFHHLAALALWRLHQAERCLIECRGLNTEFRWLNWADERSSVLVELLTEAADAISAAESRSEVTRRLLEDAPELLKAIKEAASEERASMWDRTQAARTAAEARHKKTRMLRSRAIELYSRRQWRSVRDAARQIFPALVEMGEEIGFRFSDQRGEQTVYEWLLAYRKDQAGGGS